MSELSVTLEDLGYLRELLVDGWQVRDVDARRMSAMLRRLLVEGELGRSWRAAGLTREPSLLSLNLRRQVAGRPYVAVTVAIAGAPRLEGCRTVGHILDARGFARPQDLAKASRAPEELPLSKWLEQPGILTRGTFVARRLVVKYVANRLGGVHYGVKDNRDAPWFRALDCIPADRGYVGSDENSVKQAVFAELVAIGQTVAFSDAARALAEKSAAR